MISARRIQGMTVLELLVAATVFLGMLGFVSLAVVSYMRASRRLMPQEFSSLSLTNGLDALSHQIRNSTRVYAPDAASLGSGARPDASSPLVLALRDATVTGYYFDGATQTVQQLDFSSPSYDPKQLPHAHHKVADASGLWMQLQGLADQPEWTLRLEAPQMLAFQTSLSVAADLFP